MPAKKTVFGTPQMTTALPFTTGKYLFVCNASNVNSSNGNTGLRPEYPLNTVDYAIGLCDANKMDVIVVMPGHAETVTATSIAHDVAGVQVIGVGTGLKRPTFTFGAAAATITVSAANGVWSNCHFIANFADVAAAFTIGAAKDFRIENCSFVDAGASLNFLSAVVTGSTANAADGLTVVGCNYYGLATTENAFVSVLGALNRLLLTDNNVDKAATNDAGQFLTVAALVIKNARVLRNTLNVVGSAGAAVAVFMTGSSTTNTGVLAYNLLCSLDTTGALFTTAALNLALFENYTTGAIANSGLLWPAADTPS